jgi:large conductance mechanosensitive channel
MNYRGEWFLFRAEDRHMTGLLREFREFAMRGNVVDMAVGIIIGAAFGKIVSSIVDDVIMPPIGWILGKVDFSDLYINLTGESYPSLQAAKTAGAPVIGYGVFINTCIHFIIVAFAVFMLIKWMNRLRDIAGTAPAEAPPPPPREEVLLEEIRDILKQAPR